MSTRATIQFLTEDQSSPVCVVYRRQDGHPEELGEDLAEFFLLLAEATENPPFDDPGSLAARWIVYDSYLCTQARHMHPDPDNPNVVNALWSHEVVNFLGESPVRIVPCDPPDINHRYYVLCGRGHAPKIEWERVSSAD